MWRNAQPEEKGPYVEEELKERTVYKAQIAEWKLAEKKKEMKLIIGHPYERKSSNFFDTTEQPISNRASRYSDGRSFTYRNMHEYRKSVEEEPIRVAHNPPIPQVRYAFRDVTNRMEHYAENPQKINDNGVDFPMHRHAQEYDDYNNENIYFPSLDSVAIDPPHVERNYDRHRSNQGNYYERDYY